MRRQGKDRPHKPEYLFETHSFCFFVSLVLMDHTHEAISQEVHLHELISEVFASLTQVSSVVLSPCIIVLTFRTVPASAFGGLTEILLSLRFLFPTGAG